MALVIDAADVDALREFWVGALGYEPFGAAGRTARRRHRPGSSRSEARVPTRRRPADATKNRLHLDIVVGDEIEAEASDSRRLAPPREPS